MRPLTGRPAADPLQSIEHMFVLGIDPGLTTTGFAVLSHERGTSTAVTAGVLRTSPDDPMADRLSELHRDICEVIAEHRPQAAAIEQVFVNRNLQTAIGVARASGVAMLAAATAGIPVYEYQPTAIKAAVTGDGRADKRQIQEMVRRRLKLDTVPQPADAADALAVALCHVQSRSGVRT